MRRRRWESTNLLGRKVGDAWDRSGNGSRPAAPRVNGVGKSVHLLSYSYDEPVQFGVVANHIKKNHVHFVPPLGVIFHTSIFHFDFRGFSPPPPPPFSLDHHPKCDLSFILMTLMVIRVWMQFVSPQLWCRRVRGKCLWIQGPILMIKWFLYRYYVVNVLAPFLGYSSVQGYLIWLHHCFDFTSNSFNFRHSTEPIRSIQWREHELNLMAF